MGGYLNAFTTEELTCFHARSHHKRLGDLLDVLTDMLVRSRFAPADISKERDVIKEEIAMYRDQPHQSAIGQPRVMWVPPGPISGQK